MVRYDSYATGGSAIYSLKNVEVYGSNFENNSGTRFVVMGRNVNASDCTFSNNSNYDPYGAGVLGAGINMNVDNCTFICNTSGKYGAAVYGTDVVVNNSKFINNTGNKNYLGSGIYSNGNLNVSNSLFEGNTANFRGGAILVDGIGNIDNCTFINNTAYKSGGAISGTTINVNNSNFKGNYASKYGAAIFAVNATINNSNFTNNHDGNNSSIFAITNYTINNSNDDNRETSLNLTKIVYGTYRGLINFSNGYYGYCIEPYATEGGDGYAIDDLSSLTDLNGNDVSEYLKIFIWYYYNNTNVSSDLLGYDMQLYLAEFTTGNFNRLAKYYLSLNKTVELYESGFRVPTHNAVRKLDNGSYMIFNFKTFLTTTVHQTCIMFNVSYLDELDTHMEVEKITVKPLVNLTSKAPFIIRVTNDCNYTLDNVFVVEDKWDDGLVYDSWNNDANWTHSLNDGKHTWYYINYLAPGESAEFTAYFNTTKTGNFTNYVIA